MLRRHRRALAVEQRQAERLGQVDAQKAARQETRLHVRIGERRRDAAWALQRLGGKAVVGGDHDVGGGVEPLGLQRIAQGLQVVGRIAHGGQRGRPIDAGDQAVQAVAVAVLGAVRIERPEDHDERLSRRPEPGQQHLGRHAHEPVLLRHIGAQRPRRLEIATAEFRTPTRWAGSEPGVLDRRGDLRSQRDRALAAIGGVQDDRALAVARGHVLHADRAGLADGRGGVALGARGLQQARFTEIVSSEALVHQT